MSELARTRSGAIILHRNFSPRDMARQECGPAAFLDTVRYSWGEIISLWEAAKAGISEEYQKPKPYSHSVWGVVQDSTVCAVSALAIPYEALKFHFEFMRLGSEVGVPQDFDWRVTSPRQAMATVMEASEKCDIVIVWNPSTLFPRLRVYDAAKALLAMSYGGVAVYQYDEDVARERKRERTGA